MRASATKVMRRRPIVAAVLLLAAVLLAPHTGGAALSEPDNVFHGTALGDGAPLTSGVVTATIKGEMEVLASYTLGSSPDLAASRYFLWVPMDAGSPWQTGTARAGETLEISIDGLAAAEAVLGSRGNVTALDLERCFTLYQEYYTDADGDGYSDGTHARLCSRPDGGKLAGELLSPAPDCQDDDATVHPGATEVCNGRDDNCDGTPDDGVCQRIAAAPVLFDFGSTGVGVATAAQTFTLSNPFNPPEGFQLALASVAIAGPDAVHFAIRSDLCTGASLLPGETCAITVDFTPNSAGLKADARLVIASNDPVQQPLTVALSGTGIADADGDNLLYGADNCPNVSNPDQADNDGDGLGDLCDPDDDNDLVLDTSDNCQFAANNGQTDTDGDGMGDACDPDDDNDLVLDAEDNCPLVANSQLADTDGDGLPDAQIDTDADGIGDACEVSLPDSGQRSGYTATFGEDADYELHPMLLLAAGDGTVSDENTKLIWQAQGDGLARDRAAAAEYCAELVLGGEQDWRLPERRELFSVVDFGRSSPAVNPAVFPGMAAAPFWTATPVAGAPGTGWSIDFANGAALPRSTAATAQVRCVRTAPEVQDLFEPNPAADGTLDGTVTHRATGLTWQGTEGGVRSWQAALGYCEALTLAGQQDWRLPDTRELLSLTDDERTGPAADAAVFPGIVSSNYWSSTTNAQITGQAWAVSFGSGALSAQPKTSGLRVRCVRGGEGGAIGNADLALASVEAPGQVVTGEAFTYRLAVRNRGPHTALGVVLTDTLPAGSVFEPVGSGPGCSVSGGDVACTLGIIESDAEVIVTLHGTMAASAGALNNHASVTALSHDADSTNNSLLADTTGLYRLGVLAGGDGFGSVNGNPAGYGGAGIACGATCEAGYAAPTEVTLSAVPAAGSMFFGWVGGGCSGTGDCVVTVDANVDVTALFTAYRLQVSTTGAGAGSVASLPAGDIECGSVCDRLYLAPATVTLRATAAPGSFFLGWSGACAGDGDCVVDVDAVVAVTASFTPHRLEITRDGDRSGTITSTLAGIDCGTDCEERYAAPTEVTLTAAPGPDAYFDGWTGGGCSGRGTCTVTVDGSLGVTATFADDGTIPSSSILDPVGGADFMATTYRVTGSAADSGAGLDRVEVSISGGEWIAATGTASWSYDWSVPGDGTFTIRSRATDKAGNVEIPGDAVTVTAYRRAPSKVTVSSKQLRLAGEMFTIKGVVYAPVPVGVDPEVEAPYGDYFTPEYAAIQDRDLPLLRQMGANAVLIPSWGKTADHRAFLDKAYNDGLNPVYAIAGFRIDPGLDIDPTSSANVREQLKADFYDMVEVHKNHPAILFWSIGSDLNAPGMYGGELGNLFSLIDEMAGMAHAAEGDSAHPVAAGLADNGLIATIASYDGAMANLDLWGAAVYRGGTFGTLFPDYEAVSGRPLAILGYGIDAYDSVQGDEYENLGEPLQGDYAAALWQQIEAHGEICAGGAISEFTDGWWRGKYSAGAGCPDADPAAQSACGQADATEPDGYLNEEWRGIVRLAADGADVDAALPREAYYALQYLWAPAGLHPVISESPQGLQFFGSVNVGLVSAEQTVTLANNGTTNLAIGGIVVVGTNPLDFGTRDDGCSGRTLVPAGTCTVGVVFTPTALGARSATLSVPSSDPARGTVSLDLQGQGIDTLSPTGEVTINGGKAATKRRTVTLTLSAVDLAGGPIRMCISNKRTCYSWATFTGSKLWTLPDGDGTKTVRVWFRDQWGNTSAVPYSDTIQLDTKRPSNGKVAVAKGNSQLTVSWDGFADGTGSGITGFRAVFQTGSAPLSCSSGRPVPGYDGTGMSLVHTGLVNGKTYGYRICAIDAAGNMSYGAIATGNPVPELKPPDGSVTINMTANGGAVATRSVYTTLSLTAKDEGGGAIRMCVSNLETCNSWTAFATTKSWTLLSGSGTRIVNVWFRDQYGNTSAAPVSDTIILDPTAPSNGTVTVTPGATQLTVDWSSGFTDTGSGISRYQAVFQQGVAPTTCTYGKPVPDYAGTGTTLVHTGLVNGTTYGYRICAIDAAGNRSSGATGTGKPAP